MPLSHSSTNPFRRLTEGWSKLRERREHDAALQDPNLAAEHSFAVTYATSHGGAPCPYCR